ncbi:uncharacterized protein HLK63_D01551 [Nakaseomyces glabratus]|nr:uncharacterized protein GW608_D01551 [Nakaseomyces glabratus]UCS24684.1 uncharacterized protein HLK63_D01551 [Nakaseomyces glabratus]UCS29914.1 uncharacterized protein HLK64_D01551 [Nakaseomyces glabratus]UCS35142.1 uncharacterized protein HLK62_D01551 [Nakaseomyces glabratus]
MVQLVISASQFQSQVVDLLPCNKRQKSQLIYSMLESYGLLECFDHIIDVPSCQRKDLEKFHSKDYLNVILDEQLNWNPQIDGNEDQLMELRKAWNDITTSNEASKPDFKTYSELLHYYRDHIEVSEHNKKRTALEAELSDVESGDEVTRRSTLAKFNLLDDCPIFPYLPLYCYVSTGATLSLAQYILEGSERTIAINWDGGRHHSMKTKASGFCYINDIALLIMTLRRGGVDRISYVDFDLHHGDGVEKAFKYSKQVQTISLHMYETGFFPCSGSLEDNSSGKSIVNIPLLHGLDDSTLQDIAKRIIVPSISKHQPNVIVIQCGGDGLKGDKYSEWQLSIKGLTSTITSLIEQFNCHIVLLGGGGYNNLLMSRFYTYLTWSICHQYASEYSTAIDDLIQDHCYSDLYSPEQFKFWYYDQETSGGSLKNYNTTAYIEDLIKNIPLT